MNDPALKHLTAAEDLVVTRQEAADILGITERSLAGLIQRGLLTSIPFKGQQFIALYELQLYQYRQKGSAMIEVPENLYIGINPHLHSLLQTPGVGATTSLYPSFHSDHITHIKDHLNRYLPPAYIAVTEPSLQIQGKKSAEDTFSKDSAPEPDIAIYQQKPRPGSLSTVSGAASSPTLHLELQLESQKEIMGISIYELKGAEHGLYGDPLVRIELLSPSNMPGGSYDAVYQYQRTKCFLAGIPLIELDYLHEYASPMKGVPHYPNDSSSKPYIITLTHPQIKAIDVYLFGINEPIPTVTISLSEGDQINFNFGEPYQYTWESSRFGNYIDYSKDPLRMNRYSQADQHTIRQHMQTIAARYEGS